MTGTTPRRWPMCGPPTPAALGGAPLPAPAASHAPPPAGLRPGAPADAAAWEAVSSAIGVLTARLSRIPPGELGDGEPPAATTAALAALSVAMMTTMFGRKGTRALLRRLGADAALHAAGGPEGSAP